MSLRANRRFVQVRARDALLCIKGCMVAILWRRFKTAMLKGCLHLQGGDEERCSPFSRQGSALGA